MVGKKKYEKNFRLYYSQLEKMYITTDVLDATLS